MNDVLEPLYPFLIGRFDLQKAQIKFHQRVSDVKSDIAAGYQTEVIVFTRVMWSDDESVCR